MLEIAKTSDIAHTFAPEGFIIISDGFDSYPPAGFGCALPYNSSEGSPIAPDVALIARGAFLIAQRTILIAQRAR